MGPRLIYILLLDAFHSYYYAQYMCTNYIGHKYHMHGLFY